MDYDELFIKITRWKICQINDKSVLFFWLHDLNQAKYADREKNFGHIEY